MSQHFHCINHVQIYSLGCYQSSSLHYSLLTTQTTKIIFNINQKAGVFLSFYSIYFLIVARIWGSENNRSEIVKLNTDGLNHIYNTFQRLNTLLESFFNGPVIFYFIPPVILLFIFIILTVYKNRNNSLATKMLLLLLSIELGIYISSWADIYSC